jgi:hypothetical protein
MKKSRKTRTPVSSKASLAKLEQRHRAVLQQIEGIGMVLRGSIGAYRVRCGKSYCPCKDNREARHGPYNLWTRKVAAKTLTVRLTDEQADHCRDWMTNMKRLDHLVTELQEIGLEAAEAIRASD